jgi:hypothetical protein
MTRPGVIAADPSKPLATEAHPNPSIPEAAEESAPKGKTFQIFEHFFVYAQILVYYKRLSSWFIGFEMTR